MVILNLIIYGLIGLLCLTPNLFADFSYNPVTGRLDKVTPPEETIESDYGNFVVYKFQLMIMNADLNNGYEILIMPVTLNGNAVYCNAC